MLTAPAIRDIDGVLVWADDQVWYRFYLTAPEPRVRRDADGNPIFLLVKYRHSDRHRAENPDADMGGGYLTFDVSFELNDAERERVREEMQLHVDQRWRELRNGNAQERNLPGVGDRDAPPAVEFAAPTYTGGTAKMFASQNTELFGARVAEGEPDLMSGNVAVFNIDATPDGARFLEQTLTGGGESDLVPISVRYDLTFMARLPPVDIHVTADAERIYKKTREFMDGEGRHACTTYDFEQSDIDTSTAELGGLIEVHIDPGSSQVDVETMDELRQYALDMMQQMIESNFFTDDPREGHNPDFPDGPPEEVLEREEAEQKTSDNDKKYLRKSFDSAKMNLELNLKQHSVVDWRIAPQVTLQSFFSDVPEERLGEFVRPIVLADPEFQVLDLTVRAFADFENSDIEAVEVQVDYSHRDADGQRVDKGNSFTFTSREPQRWSPALIDGRRRYKYRYRVKEAGRDFGVFSPWMESESRDLNVAAANPAKIELLVVAGDMDFEQVGLRTCEVTIAYEDTEAGVGREESVILLTRERTEAKYERMIGTQQSQPVTYKTRFAFEDGHVIEDDGFTEAPHGTLIVNQPFTAALEVRLLPSGAGWREVAQAVVELSYEDPANGVAQNDTLRLKSLDDFTTWKVPLRDPRKTDYTWTAHISYKNGDLEQTGPDRGEGSGVLAIQARLPQSTEVRIVPSRLDFEAAPVAEVFLRHPESGREATLVFDKKQAQTWEVPVPPGGPIRYEVRVTHFPADGDPVKSPTSEERDTVVVLAPYRVPEPGQITVKVMPALIDFAGTPMVTVDVTYTDERNQINATQSLAFSDKTAQTAVFDVADRNRRLISYTVTYYPMPDLQPVVGETLHQNRHLIIVPPYQKAREPA